MDALKEELDKIVSGLVGPELVEKWWNSPNKYFGDKTPLEVYKSGIGGEMDVKSYLYFHGFLSGGS